MNEEEVDLRPLFRQKGDRSKKELLMKRVSRANPTEKKCVLFVFQDGPQRLQQGSSSIQMGKVKVRIHFPFPDATRFFFSFRFDAGLRTNKWPRHKLFRSVHNRCIIGFFVKCRVVHFKLYVIIF